MDYLTYRWTTHGIAIFYTTYISVDLAQYELSRAKVGKGGINQFITSSNIIAIAYSLSVTISSFHLLTNPGISPLTKI